jgi:plastocyanin domain-containing protein
MRAMLVAFAVLGLAGCSKKSSSEKEHPHATEQKPGQTAEAAKGTVGADGVRTVPITAGMEGYVPDTIPGKPGEKLKLVFTRTVEGECLSNVKTPDGTLVPLPMNQPVEVAITVPETGSLTFACGMGMFEGKIVAGG